MNIKMNFENGELASHLTANNSLFASTATIIKNLNVVENGGLVKRSGLKYLSTLKGYGKIIPFNNNLLVFTDDKVTILNDCGVEIATATSPYFTEHLDSLDWVVNNNKLYLSEKHYNLMIVEFENDVLTLKEQKLKNLNENPAHITFYENRLVIAGTNKNPSKVYMSKIGEYFDFNIGEALADDAIEIDLISGDETITSVIASANLQVFTCDSEWKIAGSPMTPQNISVIKQSSYGSKGVKPIVIGGTTIFIPKKSGVIRNLVYNEIGGGYISQNLCEYAPHLVDNVFEMTFAGDKILLLATGYITTATILKNHLSFTKMETNGIFISSAFVNNKTFFIVKRNGNFLLEMFDDNFFMDSFVSFNFETPTQNIKGLSHLKNTSVMIFADDNLYNGVVNMDGELQLVKEAKNIKVGIPYEFLLLPNGVLSSDIVVDKGFKLQELKLFLTTAKSFEIDTGNGFETIDFQYDLDTYDYNVPPKEIKGIIKITGGNWNFNLNDCFFLLKATNPYDFKLQSITANLIF